MLDFYGAVEHDHVPAWVRTRYLLQLPIGKEDEFKGIIDLFEMKAYIYNDDKGEDITYRRYSRGYEG